MVRVRVRAGVRVKVRARVGRAGRQRRDQFFQVRRSALQEKFSTNDFFADATNHKLQFLLWEETKWEETKWEECEKRRNGKYVSWESIILLLEETEREESICHSWFGRDEEEELSLESIIFGWNNPHFNLYLTLTLTLTLTQTPDPNPNPDPDPDLNLNPKSKPGPNPKLMTKMGIHRGRL
jgi:hypothetical protein